MAKVTLNDLSRALGLNEKEPKKDFHYYGTIVSSNPEDRTYEVSINRDENVTVEAARLVGAAVGDTVMVTVMANGYATVTGRLGGDLDATDAQRAADNAADVASSAMGTANTAMTNATEANRIANNAKTLAENAEAEAGRAKTAADNAVIEAARSASAAEESERQAKRSADAADASEASAQQSATAAANSQASAAQSAQSAADSKASAERSEQSAQESATSAANSAASASRSTIYANAALNQLGIVEDVAGTLDWIAKHGTYSKTTDTTINSEKVYFVYDSSTGDYTPVIDPKASELSTYYELDITESQGDFIMSHLAVTSRGLWVLPNGMGTASDPQNAPKYKALLAADGMWIYDDHGVMVAKYGDGISFDSTREYRIGDQNTYIRYIDSNNDGIADRIEIKAASISLGSTDLATKISNIEGQISSTDQDLANYITSQEGVIEDLQNQIDGAIDTWYYSGDPTLSNQPAVAWTTDETKENHLRDLYFNTANGHSFRFAKEGNTYKWIQIEDADAIKALADAAAAQGTANVKKRVFVTTPYVPYDVGDLWVAGSKGDIKKCKTSKTSSQSYAAADWELASKYTDDTYAKNVESDLHTNYYVKSDFSVEPDKISSTINSVSETKANAAQEAAISAAAADATTKADAAEANAKADTTNKLKSYYTKTQTDSAITQKADNILSTVSTTYQTKADMDDYSTTAEMNSAIDQKADSITSTVSQTYATKTQAQGYANTAESNAKTAAATDATSKANAAKQAAIDDAASKYYTKTQTYTKSEIEEKAGEISLSVAQEEVEKVISVKEASGNIVHIEDASEYPALSLKVHITPKQSGTGTPSPDNVREISGWESVKTSVSGKNIVDWTITEQTFTSSFNGFGQGKWQERMNIPTSWVGKMLTYSAYFVTGSDNNQAVKIWLYKDGTYLPPYKTGSYIAANSSGVSSITITIPSSEEANQIAFGLGVGGGTTVSKPQVEIGTTATAYEPYTGTTTTTLLGRTVYGGTLDVVSGVLTVDRAMVDLGTLTWYFASDGRMYSSVISNIQRAEDRTAANMICSNYAVVSDYEVRNKLGDKIMSVGGDKRLYVYDSSYTDAATFKTAMSGVQLCYELSTPVTYQLTPTEVSTLLGENNVWANSGDVYLRYATMNSDMQALMGKSNDDLSRAKAEIKVTTDSISTEVAKKVGNDEVISKINQSAESVKIQASKVEIDGTATFNAIKSKTDAAYDAKGAADAKKSIHTLDSSYSQTYARLLAWSKEGYDAGGWAVSSTAGVAVGDTVRIKCSVSDMNNAAVYVLGTVTAVRSATILHMTSHGLDTTVIDGGNILTNSITANQLNVSNIQSNVVQTAELSADKITSGTLSADRIAAGSLTVGQVSGLQTTLNSKADESDIPTKVSDLTNDSGFQNATQVSSIAEGKASTAESNAKSYADTKASDASKIATNYLSFDETDGLDIGYTGKTERTNIKADGMRIYDSAGDQVASLTNDGSQIGKTGKANFKIGANNMTASDDNNEQYFSVSKNETVIGSENNTNFRISTDGSGIAIREKTTTAFQIQPSAFMYSSGEKYGASLNLGNMSTDGVGFYPMENSDRMDLYATANSYNLSIDDGATTLTKYFNINNSVGVEANTKNFKVSDTGNLTINGNLTLNSNKTMNDFVVTTQADTAYRWFYHKWKSGMIEAWYHNNDATFTLGKSIGNGWYRNENAYTIDMPSGLTTVHYVELHVYTGNSAVFSTITAATTSQIRYHVQHYGSMSGQSGHIMAHVIGRYA